MASADHKKASRSSVIRAKAELPTNSTNAKKEATAKVIKKTMLKLCRNSSRLFLKNDTDTYPFVERHQKSQKSDDCIEQTQRSVLCRNDVFSQNDQKQEAHTLIKEREERKQPTLKKDLIITKLGYYCH